MLNWTTFGHKHIKKVLEFQVQNGTPAHAYLFTGSKGVGKSVLAQEFATFLSPAPGNRMYFDIEASGKIEDVREILRLSSLTSTDGSKKVVILDNFEEASTSVANALLKTLEEPSLSTVFILVCSGAGPLATIVSRCTVMRFGSLSEQEMADFAETQGWQPTDAEYTYSAGIPGRLTKLFSGNEEAKTSLEAVTKINEAANQGDAQRLMLAADLAEHDTPLLKDILDAWTAHLVAGLPSKPQQFSAIKVAQETLNRLSMNANKKMAMEFFTLNTKL